MKKIDIKQMRYYIDVLLLSLIAFIFGLLFTMNLVTKHNKQDTAQINNTIQDGSMDFADMNLPIGDTQDTKIAFAISSNLNNQNAKEYNLKPLTAVTNADGYVELLVGERVMLDATVYYSEKTNPVQWTSSDDKVVSVDKKGMITATGEGRAKVTFSSGGISGQVGFIIKDLSLKAIRVSEETLTLEPGQSKQLTVFYNPKDTTDSKKVQWSSENNKVATVENGMVKAVGTGTTRIIAQVGNHSSICSVSVAKKVQDIYLSCIESNIDIGSTLDLEVFFIPEDATENKTITWSSSDESVATVDKAGKVTTLAPGTATITADVNGHKATCKVMASFPELSEDSIEMIMGDTFKLMVKNNILSREIIWSSEDESIATVDESGVIMALSLGQVNICAQVNDRKLFCTVHIIGQTEKEK